MTGVWLVVALAIIVGVCWYFFGRSTFPLAETKAATGTFIISLTDTTTDAQGIPYRGAVLFDPASGAYSYIATHDKGTVTPVDASSFSSGTNYLAIRTGSSTTNELVLYDYKTLSPERVIRELSLKTTVQSAAWSPDGKIFAYLVAGAGSPTLFVSSVTATAAPKSFGYDIPVGFSPDGTKLLTRGTSVPVILSTTDGVRTQTTGMISLDATVWMMVSPSGKYVVAASGKTAHWYVLDWKTGKFSSLGTIALGADDHNMLFSPDDSLIVARKGSDTARVYSYHPGKGFIGKRVVNDSSVRLSLPDGARLLHAASWK